MRPMRIAGAPRHRRRPRRPANSPRGGPPRQPESPSAVAPLFLAVREPSPSCLCAVAEAVTTDNRQALRRACRRLAVEVSQQPAGSATTAHAQARACACMRATERRARVVRRQGCETALGPDARRSRPSARRRAGEREWEGGGACAAAARRMPGHFLGPRRAGRPARAGSERMLSLAVTVVPATTMINRHASLCAASLREEGVATTLGSCKHRPGAGRRTGETASMHCAPAPEPARTRGGGGGAKRPGQGSRAASRS